MTNLNVQLVSYAGDMSVAPVADAAEGQNNDVLLDALPAVRAARRQQSLAESGFRMTILRKHFDFFASVLAVLPLD